LKEKISFCRKVTKNRRGRGAYDIKRLRYIYKQTRARINRQRLEANRVKLQIIIDDIRNTKNQMWRIVYYGILLQTAIIGYKKIIEPNIPCAIVVMLVILSILASVTTIILVFIYTLTLKEYRKNKISTATNLNYGLIKTDLFSWKDGLHLFVFITTQIIATCLTCYYLFCRS